MTKEILCNVMFHYKGVDKKIEEFMGQEFMNHRNEYCDVFNEYIGEINDAFHEIHGEVNPLDDVEMFNEYSRYIAESIQPRFDELNDKPVSRFLEFYIDPEDQCDIKAKVRGCNKSEISISINMI